MKKPKMFHLDQYSGKVLITGALVTEKSAWMGKEPLEPQQLGPPPTAKLQPRDDQSKIPPWEPFCYLQGIIPPPPLINGKQEQTLLSPKERIEKYGLPREKREKCKERKRIG